MGRRSLLVLAMMAPLLLAAKDPGGDFVSCATGKDVEGPGLDIVSAKGETIENGTALRLLVTFAEEPPDTGPGGKAWRVDFVLRDPRKPTFSFGPYEDVNRIVRYDNTDPPKASIILLAEQGLSQPSTFILEGPNLLITVAGRQLEIGENLEPGSLRPIRWNVISRFGGVCDHLRGGAATLRLTPGGGTAVPTAAPSPTATTSDEPAVPTRGDPWLPLAIFVFVGLMLGAFLIARQSGIEDLPPPGTQDPNRPTSPHDTVS